MSDKLSFERFALITAEVYDASVDEVEAKISRSKAEAIGRQTSSDFRTTGGEAIVTLRLRSSL